MGASKLLKTGSARRKDDQVTSYLDIPRVNGFDGVLTVSTQITADSSETPVTVDQRKLKGTALAFLTVARRDRSCGATAIARNL